MPFITQGKTSVKRLAVIIVLTILAFLAVAGIFLYYQVQSILPEILKSSEGPDNKAVPCGGNPASIIKLKWAGLSTLPAEFETTGGEIFITAKATPRSGFDMRFGRDNGKIYIGRAESWPVISNDKYGNPETVENAILGDTIWADGYTKMSLDPGNYWVLEEGLQDFEVVSCSSNSLSNLSTMDQWQQADFGSLSFKIPPEFYSGYIASSSVFAVDPEPIPETASQDYIPAFSFELIKNKTLYQVGKDIQDQGSASSSIFVFNSSALRTEEEEKDGRKQINIYIPIEAQNPHSEDIYRISSSGGRISAVDQQKYLDIIVKTLQNSSDKLTEPQVQGWKSYCNPREGSSLTSRCLLRGDYSLAYPSDWSVKEDSEWNVVFNSPNFRDQDQSITEGAQIGISFRSIPADLSLDDLVSQLEKKGEIVYKKSTPSVINHPVTLVRQDIGGQIKNTAYVYIDYDKTKYMEITLQYPQKTSQAEKDNYLAIFERMFYHDLSIGY
jgi:hypothetical protein